jgi:hypothetical protein
MGSGTDNVSSTCPLTETRGQDVRGAQRWPNSSRGGSELAFRRHAPILAAVSLVAAIQAFLPARVLGAAKPVISGSHQGISLLTQVHRAYREVPAVSVVAASSVAKIEDLLVLRAGVVQAEDFRARDRSGMSHRVIVRGEPTFWKAPGSACWRALSASSPLSLSLDIGERFPIPNNAQSVYVGSPAHGSGGTWSVLLRITEFNGHSSSVKVVIDSSKRRVRAFVYPGIAVARVSALGSKPKLPTPVPRCTA